MSKFQLEVDYEEEDIGLIGISYHGKDYTLCWALNKELGVEMERADRDLECYRPKHGISVHPVFHYLDEEDRVNYSLIANRGDKGYLLPELKQADFVLMVEGEQPPVDDLVEAVRNPSDVLTGFKVDMEQLESRENLFH